MLLRRKTKKADFDKTGKTPVIRSSICTGEQVAGFRDEQSGRFTEVMLIRSAADFEEFLQRYDLTAEEVARVW